MGNVIKMDDYEMTVLQKLLKAPTVIDSICNWNAARYKQEPNHELSMALLFEELDEIEAACTANDKIGILDGLGDIFYVTIGVLWKTGLTALQIQQLIDHVESMNHYKVNSPAVALHWYCDDPQNHVLAILALSALARLEWLLGSDELAMEVIRAICISNDSKEVKKTPSHIKANLQKGKSYTPPTRALESILARSCDAN